MVGSDVSIVWVDDEDGAQAVDYHLSAYTQVCEHDIRSVINIRMTRVL